MPPEPEWRLLKWLQLQRRVLFPAIALAALTIVVTISSCPDLEYEVTLVDVIVYDWSSETKRHPEPDIAVNPNNRDEIAISAWKFGLGDDITTMCAPSRAPVVMTFDGGANWSERCVTEMPMVGSSYRRPVDQTLDFSGDGSSLVTSFLSVTSGVKTLRVQGITSWQTPGAEVPSDLLGGSVVDDTDIPWLSSWHSSGTNTQLVGTSQGSGIGGGTTCSYAVVWTWSAGTAAPQCVGVRVEPSEKTLTVRTAIHHASGMAYALFLAPAPGGTDQLVIVKGNVSAGGTPVFDKLKEDVGAPASGCPALDTKLGVRIKCGLVIPIDESDDPEMGWERRGPYELAIAVDPRNSDRVFVAYGDGAGGELMALHLIASTDGGRTFGAEMILRNSSLNPALAVDNDGRLAFLYQKYSNPTGGPETWNTIVEVSDESQANWRAFGLSTTPADFPVKDSDPYLGDYVDLVAVGKTFYGVFSANNDPAHHKAAKYQRKLDTDGAGNRSLSGGVATSIDPFFFALRRKAFLAKPWSWAPAATKIVGKTVTVKKDS